MVRHLRQPRRLPVHVRPRAPVAQEPARQQRPARSVGDGVDPNRNFAEHWGYDNEGSSPDPRTRPTAVPAPPRSPRPRRCRADRPHRAEVPVEPALLRRVAALSAGLAGRHARRGLSDLRGDRRHRCEPAIPGFNPGQSADTLYVTNGETTDYADTNAGTVAFTPELGEGTPGAGFVFPDDEELIQAEFERTLDFRWAWPGPRRIPKSGSPVGIDVEPFYLDADDIDPQNGQTSLFDFKFSVSYGDPQEVRVLASGASTSRCITRINGGATRARRRASGTAASATARQRHVLPRRQRRCDRHRPGRQRRGVVRGRR